MELYEMSAAELALLIKKGGASSEEVTGAFLKRIGEVDGKIGAFITVDGEGALEKAREVDKKRASGAELSPLAGIPVGLKDNICTDGVRTTCAAKMLENFVPQYDATVVKKLKENDMVIVGKLNLDEFAMGSSCESSYFGETRNPHDLERVPGGSSGGSAAALAGFEIPLALGTDTGGSIRQPSSFCGVVGLKPTYGAVSRSGVVAFASSLDQVGAMGRNATDTAMLFDVIRGHDPKDATSEHTEEGPVAAGLTGDVKGLKIGLPKEFFGEGISPFVSERIMAAAEAYKRLGAELIEISTPMVEYALPAYYIISSAEASSNMARFDGVRYGYRAEGYTDLVDMYKKTRSEAFGDEVKRRIMLGTYVLSSGYYDAYYGRAQKVRGLITAEFEKAFEKCDLLLTPTAPTTAFKLGEHTDDVLAVYMADYCTVAVNMARLPAIVHPVGTDAGGLPVGAQLIGPKWSEKTLLGAVYAYEQGDGDGYVRPKL